MQKFYQIRCPKCNNLSNFYHYSKDNPEFQSINALTALIDSYPNGPYGGAHS